MVNLSGTWLGTYWQAGMPTRFELTLLQSGNALSGSILDDSYLGEAALAGEVIGRRVSFSKRYLTGSRHSVDYVGTVNEEENLIQGKWQIKFFAWGNWEARRSGDNLTLEIQTRQSQQVPLTVSQD